jgi:hypothetical protein
VTLHNEFWDTASTLSETTFCPDQKPGRSFSLIRTNLLWRTLAVTKSYLQAFLSMPSSNFFPLTFTTWSRLCDVLIVHTKLVFFKFNLSEEQDPATTFSTANTGYEVNFWNSELAAKEAEMSHLCAVLQEKLAEVTSDRVNDDGGRDAMYINLGWC